jgi:hypothetical protein
MEELHQRLVDSNEQVEELRNELKSIQKEKVKVLIVVSGLFFIFFIFG